MELNFFEWITCSSIMTSVLLGFILLFKRLLRGRLDANWQYYIWVLLVLKLLIPFGPESPTSIFNAMDFTQEKVSYGSFVIYDSLNSAANTLKRELTSDTSLDPIETVHKQGLNNTLNTWEQQGYDFTLVDVWLIGVVLLIGISIFLLVKSWLMVKKLKEIKDVHLLDLLEDCKQKLGIKRKITILETYNMKTPALYGLFRPTLLLPHNMLTELSANEIRYVFYHELAHLKRRDIPMNFLLGFLQILHWFNPLIWYAFYRMRQDAELACDALALSHMDPKERKDYGRMIIKMIENYVRPSRIPAMAGILGTKSQLKRRITMITLFKKKSLRWTLITIMLFVVMAFGILTNAMGARRVDKVDYPFVNDPAVSGKWESVDFVKKMDKFTPNKKSFGEDLFLKNLYFSSNGKMPTIDWTWTKGLVLDKQDKTASKYIIKNINGQDYMFFEWKSGDYTLRGMDPWFYVLKRIDRTEYTEETIPKKEDKIDYPFVNDPTVIGKWESVDFVRKIELFKVNKKSFEGDLFLKNLYFSSGGKIPTTDLTWTKGLVLNKRDKTASKYIIKTIKGQDYMFFEWKSGDYTLRGMDPQYYVLKRVDKIDHTEDTIPKKTDNIDLPFINDPDVLGKWQSVDFVVEKDQFQPGKTSFGAELYLKGMNYLKDGGLEVNYTGRTDTSGKWTKNVVINAKYKTASAYEIKKIAGQTYMFFEWKSGDYVFRGMKPCYYVLKKVGEMN
ncbi:MAG: M56 family metallopeptidase [Clostridia bacterium]|nr:M56 family metallopeptidase [Clostridia bacterium]